VRIDILTLFPEVFRGPFEASIIGRAVQAGLLQVFVHNIRDYAEGRHKVVDDYSFGGGPGMVMKPEPLFQAVESVVAQASPGGRVVLLTPQGRLLTQEVAQELSGEERLLLICGHYEGVDERVREHLVDDEVSIGDYVLLGGEFPALVVVDAVVRCVPGVLGSESSLEEESHAEGLLEYPQYTRPAEFRGWRVPEALLSGHHAEIARWRRQRSLLRTARRRPDLLARAKLTDQERRWLEEHLAEEEERPLEEAVGPRKSRTASS
jgi:tRNA (guanine37-N1)-methyltransferase